MVLKAWYKSGNIKDHKRQVHLKPRLAAAACRGPRQRRQPSDTAWPSWSSAEALIPFLLGGV